MFGAQKILKTILTLMFTKWLNHLLYASYLKEGFQKRFFVKRVLNLENILHIYTKKNSHTEKKLVVNLSYVTIQDSICYCVLTTVKT